MRNGETEVHCKNNLSPGCVKPANAKAADASLSILQQVVWIKKATYCFRGSCVVKMEEVEVKGEEKWVTAGKGFYLEADVLQVLGMPLDDLLNEVRMSGAQVRRGRLIKLELKPPPQIGGVKDVIPAAGDGRGPGPVHQGQVLEDLQDDMVGQVTPVL